MNNLPESIEISGTATVCAINDGYRSAISLPTDESKAIIDGSILSLDITELGLEDESLPMMISVTNVDRNSSFVRFAIYDDDGQNVMLHIPGETKLLMKNDDSDPTVYMLNGKEIKPWLYETAADKIITSYNVVGMNKLWDVTLPAGLGYTATADANSNCITVDGDSFSFTVALDSKYEKSSTFAVKVNGTPLAEKDGKYTIDNITEAKTITVEGVKLKDVIYNISEGANSTWTKGKNDTLTFSGDGDLAKFKSIKVDGSVVDTSNYDKSAGSTIIKLKSSYLATLAVGSHTLEIVWSDGTGTTPFSVKEEQAELRDEKTITDVKDTTTITEGTTSKAISNDSNSVKTGDETNIMLWLVALSLSACMFTSLVVIKRHKNKSIS